MTGKGLLKRILVTLALAAGLTMYLAAVQAEATPIRPNIRKIVSQPQQDATSQPMPARAGWDGPEMTVGRQQGSSQTFRGERLARAERAELMAAATPDPRAILGILAVIFLLRLLRRQDERRPQMRAMLETTENTQERIAA